MSKTIPKLKIVAKNGTGEVLPAANVLDLAFVIRYIEAGLTDQEIAKLCNCIGSDVLKFRTEHDLEGNTLQNFIKMKGSVFNLKLKTAASTLDAAKINSMTGLELIKGIDILNKNARLETGQVAPDVAAQIFGAVKVAEIESDARHNHVPVEAEVI